MVVVRSVLLLAQQLPRFVGCFWLLVLTVPGPNGGGGGGAAAVVQGHPYMILTSTRSKCLSVLAPQGQTITIQYDAPGEYTF
jgi:hypothetical protein